MPLDYFVLSFSQSAARRTCNIVAFLSVYLHIAMHPYSEKILISTTQVVADGASIPKHDGCCGPFVNIFQLKA